MPESRSASRFVGTTTPPKDVAADVLFVPVFQSETHLDDCPGIDEATAGELSHALASGEFRAKPCETLTAATNDAWASRRVVFVGAGEREGADAERVRRIAATCGYVARRRSAHSMAIVTRGLDPRGLADGISAAEFDSGVYKSADPAAVGRFPTRVEIVAPGADEHDLAERVSTGRTIGESVNFTRSLANEPGNVLTPREFAVRVAGVEQEVGLTVEVLDEHRLAELGMRLLLGVGQGSAEPPRLIAMKHIPPGAPDTPVLGLVGKGITFDTGGISIKPADGMERMKTDMSGAAAVIGAMRAISLLKAPIKVVGVIPSAENMPGGRATRPSDVLTGASGTTVEVVNTDAEGRLILGDGLWYARELGATHLVDVATLTGACVVALGKYASGLFAQPESWSEVVRRTAQRAGDRCWPMPLYEEYRDQIKSDIADIVNSGGRPGGACTAAVFLKEFAGDMPWAHLDIAGTAWAEESKPWQAKGSTGVAVRTLAELAFTTSEWT